MKKLHIGPMREVYGRKAGERHDEMRVRLHIYTHAHTRARARMHVYKMCAREFFSFFLFFFFKENWRRSGREKEK